MKLVSAEQAVASIENDSTIFLPGGCANPYSFYDAFSQNVDQFSGLTICSGLSLGDYRFLNKGLGVNYSYTTWQAGAGLRKIFEGNKGEYVNFIPLRLSDLTKVVGGNGSVLKPDTVVIQTSLPAENDAVSLGISVGPNLHFIRHAKKVIAEMNHNMPITAGDSIVPISDIDVAIESNTPLAEYDTGQANKEDLKIVENVLSLIPSGATVQLGIGAIPDRVLSRLGEIKDVKLDSGLLSTGLLNFLDSNNDSERIIVGELAGTSALYTACNQHERIQMAGLDITHNVNRLSIIKNFVSVNSTIEIDLMGQCNGETLGPTQVSGVGGSLDFIEASSWSDGGLSIIAMPSTAARGTRSKIVKSISAGGVVTTPRYSVDYVVTEYGIARLRGKSLRERRRSLIEIAHPDFKSFLS